MTDTTTRALNTVLGHPKNVQTFTKYIQKLQTEDEEENIRILYQMVGDIIQNKKNLRDVLGPLKKGKVGWKHPMYDKIDSLIQEHDDYIVKPFEVVDGVVECPKCSSMKTFSVQKQTRSSDEPMTTFSRCVKCGYDWVYSG